MSAVRSRPSSVRVESEPLSPGAISFWVMTPSISTLAWPLTVATRMHRMKRSGSPPLMRKMIFSGDCLSIEKVSLNPLGSMSCVVTSTSARHSSTDEGTGEATNGPIMSVSWTLLSNRASGDALRGGDFQRRARRLDKIVGRHRAVGVADQPGHERVAEEFGGDQVEAIALHRGVSVDGGVVGRAGLRDDAALKVGNDLARGRSVLLHAEAVVAAVGREGDRRNRA